MYTYVIVVKHNIQTELERGSLRLIVQLKGRQITNTSLWSSLSRLMMVRFCLHGSGPEQPPLNSLVMLV